MGLKIGNVLDGIVYYVCDNCGYDFGRTHDIDDEWRYCPKCGKKIFED